MIPQSKFDLDALERLNEASDAEVITHIDELLEWLQDSNWPVFSGVCKRISLVELPIASELEAIFTGNDRVWKANILSSLFPLMNKSKIKPYLKLLYELKDNASLEDVNEDVIEYVENQLQRFE